MVLALLAHGLLLFLPLSMRTNDLVDAGIEVTLRRDPAPEPIPIAGDAAPLPTPAPYQPPVSEQRPVAAAPEPRVVEPDAAQAPPIPAPRIVDRLSRYRLDGHANIPEPAPPVAEPRVLGGAPAGLTLAAVLDSTPPDLPFADPDTPFVFFPTGLEGDIEKAFFKVTKEFGFKVASAKVRCAWIVVVVACAWQ